MTEPGVFWTKETSIWEPIISKKWDTALFAMKILNATYTYNPTHTTVFRTGFYNHVFELLSKESNITFLNEK
jgi:lycopene beta-cyclase